MCIRDSGLAKWIAKTPNLTLIWGQARFVGPHAVEVNGQTLEAAKIFINVGGRAVLPPWPGVADVPVLTNTSMMAIDTLPCLLYTSDAADDLTRVDLGGSRILKK